MRARGRVAADVEGDPGAQADARDLLTGGGDGAGRRTGLRGGFAGRSQRGPLQQAATLHAASVAPVRRPQRRDSAAEVAGAMPGQSVGGCGGWKTDQRPSLNRYRPEEMRAVSLLANRAAALK